MSITFDKWVRFGGLGKNNHILFFTKCNK